MNMDIKLIGAKELQDALADFPKSVERKLLRAALRKGGNVILAEARARAPVDKGVLRRSIKLRSARSRDGVALRIDVRIPPNGKPGNTGGPYYGAFVELGTSKMAAHPYLRPAFDATAETALREISEYLSNGIEAEANKGAK